MKRRTLFSLLGALGTAVLLAGCGGGGNDNPKSRVRVVNALVGTNSNVDVQVNGQNVGQNVAFGGVTASAVTVDAGSSVPVTVLQTGTNTTLASNNAVNIQSNVDEVLLVSGVAGTNGATGAQVLALSPVDLSSTPTGSQARIYFVNAAPGVTGSTFSYTVGGGNSQTAPGLNDLSFTAMSPAQLPDIPTGQTVVFTANVNGGAETFNSPAINVKGGVTYLVVLTGRPNASGGNPALAFQVLSLNE